MNFDSDIETIEGYLERKKKDEENISRLWHEMLSSEASYLCMKNILQELEYGKQMQHETDMQTRNFCDYILDKIAKGNMNVYLRLLSELKQES